MDSSPFVVAIQYRPSRLRDRLQAPLVQCRAYCQQYGLDAVYPLPVNLYGSRDNLDPPSSPPGAMIGRSPSTWASAGRSRQSPTAGRAAAWT